MNKATGLNKEEKQKILKLWLTKPYRMVEMLFRAMTPVKTPPFHIEIWEMLIKSARVLLAAPRGHAKSTMCSVFYPLWCALLCRRQCILIVSASQDVAIGFLRKIKGELENNKVLWFFFGSQVTNEKWTESHIILKNGVEIRAIGAGAQIRGRRPDLIICDDIETEDTVASSDQIEKLRTWLFKACINSLTPDGQFVWIGTIINDMCLINEYLNVDNGWDKRNYAAYIDSIEDDAHVLWPDLWSHDRLQQKKREIGSTYFASEYLNNPLADGSLPIKPHMIRNYTQLPEAYNLYMAVDPAYSEEEKSDYKVCVLVAVDGNGNRYLVNYIRQHGTIGDFQRSIVSLWQMNSNLVIRLGIPNSGTEKAFYASFKTMCDEMNIYPPLCELKNVHVGTTGRRSVKKLDRIKAALQPLFEAGRYFLQEHHTEAQQELLSIGSSKHDDLVDAMTYCEQLIDPHIKPTGNNNVDTIEISRREYVRNGTTGYGY